LPEYEFWKLIFNLKPNIFMKNGNSLRLYPTNGNLHRQLTDTTFSHVRNQIPPPANRAIAAILKTLLILILPAMVSAQCADSDFTHYVEYNSCEGVTVHFTSECDQSSDTHDWDFGDGCPNVTGVGGATISPGTDPNCITFGTYDKPEHVYNVNTYTSANTSVTVSHTVTGFSGSTTSPPVDIAAALPGAGVYVGYFDVTSILSDKITPPVVLMPAIMPAMPGGGSNWISNTNFYVFGTLQIDDNYDIRSTNNPSNPINMGKAATLNVTDGANSTLFNLNNVDVIGGCDCLWRQISVEDDCELRINNTSLVRNGLFAVYPEGGSTIRLEDATFRNNFIGLFADQGDFNLTRFEGNTYEMTSSSLSGSCGLAAAADVDELGIFRGTDAFVDFDIGFAGILTIDLADLDFPSNSGFADVTLFQDMANGIVLRNSTSPNMRYCRFEDFQPDASYDDSGYGILSTPTSAGVQLRQTGINLVTGNTLDVPTFDNCYIGIAAITTGASTLVRSSENRMETGHFGYLMRASGTSSFTSSLVHDNEINNYDLGVYVNSHPSTGTNIMEIYNLLINCATGETGGIELRGNGSAQQEVYVYDNVIHMNRSVFGIELIGWEHDNGADLGDPSEHTLHHNIINIDIDDNDPSTGILLEDSDFCILSCNEITGTYDPNDGTGDQGDGIYVMSSTDGYYLKNLITNTRWGLRFEGNCMSEDRIEQTQFIGDMEIGLLYEDQTFTLNQEDMGNDWSLGTYDSGFGAVHLDPHPMDIEASKYFMPFAAQPVWDPGTVLWFDDGGEPDPYDCEPMLMLREEEEFSEMETLIAAGEFSIEGDYSERMLRQLQATLYQKIQKADPELLDETLLAFAEEQANEPIGHLYSVQSGIANTVKELTGSYQEEISELINTIEGIQADLLYTNSQMSMDVPDLEDEKAALLEELMEELAALSEIYDAVHEAAMEEFAELLEYNNEIEPDGTIDENEIQVNRLLLERIMNPETAWAEEDWDIIETLAYTCPLSGGKAVFLPRIWYYEETGIRASGDCEAEMRNGEEENRLSLPLSVSPNPVQDVVYLDFTIPEGLTSEVIIKDLLGNTVKRIDLPSGDTVNFPIYCNDLQSGVYFILIQDHKHVLASEKIIVIH
jgi:hypothetical protein